MIIDIIVRDLEIREVNGINDGRLIDELLKVSQVPRIVGGFISLSLRTGRFISSSTSSFSLTSVVSMPILLISVGVWYKKNQMTCRKFYMGCDAFQKFKRRFHQGKLKNA